MPSTIVTILAVITVAGFPVSEILLAVFKRAKADVVVQADQGSMRILWIVIGLSVVVAKLAQAIAFGRLHVSATVAYSTGAALILAGLLVRWLAILTLGRLFTVDVAIRTDHSLIQTGLYRYIRHPSYAGLLLAFIGLGVFFDSWLSIVVLVIPIGLAMFNRIRKEEAALRAALGEEYVNYCRRTKRLVPGVL